MCAARCTPALVAWTLWLLPGVTGAQGPGGQVAAGAETLKGHTAMSVAVQVAGISDIPVATFRSDMEEILRSRGVTVLDEGYPQITLVLDALFEVEGSIGARTAYTVFVMDLEFAQALPLDGGSLARATTWKHGDFGILPAVQAGRLRSVARGLMEDFVVALQAGNPETAPRVAVTPEIRTVTRHLFMARIQAALNRVSDYRAPEARERLLQQVDELERSGQQIIDCTYGPLDPDGTGFRSYEFWYRTPPARIREMLMDTRFLESPRHHPLDRYGVNAVDECPPNDDLALHAHRQSLLPENR